MKNASVVLIVLFTLASAGCPNPHKHPDCGEGSNRPHDTAEPDVETPDDLSGDPSDAGTSSEISIGKEWNREACGGVDLKVNKLDPERGWVYLAYRTSEGMEEFSDKLPYRGKKTERAALFFGNEGLFLGVRDCSEDECRVICQTLNGEVGDVR